MRRPLLTLLVALAAAGVSILPPAAQDSTAQGSSALEPPAQHIRSGAVVRSQVVGLGRDVLVEGDALEDVAALNGSVEVRGSVRGDVVVLGGDVRLGPEAEVEGKVFVVGGTLEAAPGSVIGGRSVAYPSITSAWLTLIEAPALGLSATSPIVLAAKLALLTAWLALLLVLFAVAGRQVLATADGVSREPFRNFWVGLTGVLSLVLTALFFSAFAGPVIGLPFVVLVVLLLLLAKLWGMVAVFYATGRWIYGRLGRRGTILHAATVGLAALGLFKLLPFVGLWTWTIATFIGVGAAFTTKFGRSEPWLQLDLLDVLRRSRP